MAQLRNSGEGNGVATGTTVTSSNSAVGDTAWSAAAATAPVTMVYSSTQKAHGAMSVQCAASASANLATMRWAISNATKIALRCYLYLTALPGVTYAFMSATYTGDLSALNVQITAANKLRLDTTGSVQVFLSTADFPTNQWVRVDVYGEIGTSSTTGVTRIAYYLGDSATAIQDSGSITGANLGGSGSTNSFVNARFGFIGGGSTKTLTQYSDDMAVNTDTDATGLIGPAANAAPTLTITGNQNVAASATVNLTATAADTDGTIASIAWSFLYPTTGAPTITPAGSPSGATATFTAGAAGSLYILQCVATDNLGATNTATTEVRVPSSGNLVALPTSATTVGTVSRTGGTTDGGAVSDASDSTYLAVTQGGSATVRCVPITTRTGLTVTVRLKSPDSGTGKFYLYQGASTLIQTSSNLTLTTTATDYSIPITNWASVTDPGDLRYRVEAV